MWWAREELNLRPLPCQLTRAYRCANRRFPSSRSTVDGKVKCCLGEGDMHAPSGGEVIRTHRAGFTALALLLTPLGLLPTFPCTDSYCAQPTPYHEPCAAPPRRPRGKAARIPREWSPVGRASVRHPAIGRCTSRLLIGSASWPVAAAVHTRSCGSRCPPPARRNDGSTQAGARRRWSRRRCQLLSPSPGLTSSFGGGSRTARSRASS